MRQLNFYGFRKIKCGSLRIDDATSDESKYWKFRHEKFQQGRPDLLSQIRKSSGETVDKQEVEQLKNEVRDLKDTLSGVSDHVAQLKSLVECFILKQNLPEHKQTMNLPEVTSNKRKGLDGQEHIMSVPSSDSLVQAALTMLPSSNSSWLNMSNHQLLFDASNKKQKVADEERGMAIRSEPSFTPLPFTSSFSFQRRHLDSERNVTHVERNAVWSNLPRMPPPAPMTRYGSIGAASQTSLDEGILASLLALGDDDTPLADNSGSRNATFC